VQADVRSDLQTGHDVCALLADGLSIAVVEWQVWKSVVMNCVRLVLVLVSGRNG